MTETPPQTLFGGIIKNDQSAILALTRLCFTIASGRRPYPVGRYRNLSSIQRQIQWRCRMVRSPSDVLGNRNASVGRTQKLFWPFVASVIIFKTVLQSTQECTIFRQELQKVSRGGTALSPDPFPSIIRAFCCRHEIFLKSALELTEYTIFRPKI